MDFQATITDHRTGETSTYTQDTLDEFAAELRLRKIKGQKLTVPARSHPKHITLTDVEKAWARYDSVHRTWSGRGLLDGAMAQVVVGHLGRTEPACRSLPTRAQHGPDGLPPVRPVPEGLVVEEAGRVPHPDLGLNMKDATDAYED